MARPKKSEALDLTERINLTVGAIDRLSCPNGKAQAFLRDSEVPALRVRVTAAGAKSFVFEKKLNRQTIRRTIGAVSDWTIEAARKEAQALAVTLDKGDDPRELDRTKEEAKAQAKAEKERAAKFTFGALMADYASHHIQRYRHSLSVVVPACERLCATHRFGPKVSVRRLRLVDKNGSTSIGKSCS
jgi:hypothetical protein